MGRMKELYIEICEANGGIFPGEISLTQAIEMRELNLLNLEMWLFYVGQIYLVFVILYK